MEFCGQRLTGLGKWGRMWPKYKVYVYENGKGEGQRALSTRLWSWILIPEGSSETP